MVVDFEIYTFCILCLYTKLRLFLYSCEILFKCFHIQLMKILSQQNLGSVRNEDRCVYFDNIFSTRTGEKLICMKVVLLPPASSRRIDFVIHKAKRMYLRKKIIILVRKYLYLRKTIHFLTKIIFCERKIHFYSIKYLYLFYINLFSLIND